MNVSHFYHLYAAGQWRDPVAEHLAALADGGYDGPFNVGLVGSPEQRADALEELRWLRPPDCLTDADEGWEQVTLTALHEHAKAHQDELILYAHTKGASDPSPVNIIWRRAMSLHVVRHWKRCANAIRIQDLDAIGCHWLTPHQYRGAVTSPFFGGTFWMATAKYITTLPKCAESTRHDAEIWIGLKDPKIIDLLPGWPGSYPQVPRYQRLVASRVGQ